jgi:hypothetical protein
MRTFGLMYGTPPGSPLHLQVSRREKDGRLRCMVINGAWPCTVDLTQGTVRARHAVLPILAVYEPPPDDPLPDDYNEACAVIEARAKPLPNASASA